MKKREKTILRNIIRKIPLATTLMAVLCVLFWWPILFVALLGSGHGSGSDIGNMFLAPVAAVVDLINADGLIWIFGIAMFEALVPGAIVDTIIWIVRRRRCRLENAGVCAKCGYDLRGLSGSVCPECGQSIRIDTAQLSSRQKENERL